MGEVPLHFLMCSLHLATSGVGQGQGLQARSCLAYHAPSLEGPILFPDCFALCGSCSQRVLHGEAAGHPWDTLLLMWFVSLVWLNLSALAPLQWGSVLLEHLGLEACRGQVLCPLASPSFFDIAPAWGFSSGCGLLLPGVLNLSQPCDLGL